MPSCIIKADLVLHFPSSQTSTSQSLAESRSNANRLLDEKLQQMHAPVPYFAE